MICPKCSSTRSIELAEVWSAWNLHKMGLADPQIRVSVSCQKCGFSVFACSGKESIPDLVRLAQNRFSEGNTGRADLNISWEKAFEMVPELRDKYQGRISS